MTASLAVLRNRCLLLQALVLAAAGGPRSRSWAQVACGMTSDTPLRVESATEALTLGDAVNCLDGGTVEAVWAGVVTLDAPISVGSGTFLSITGEDDLAEVRGGSQTRLFDVSPSGGLSLTQLRLSGGSAEDGGAVYSSSATVSLDGCVFDGNAATAGDGGAVWVEGGDLTIVGGEFFGNTASENGGAVQALDAAVVITGGLFRNNTADVDGGFANIDSEEASFSCEDATIEDNNSGDKGGGIRAKGARWVNSSCDLVGNSAPDGAALFLSGVGAAYLEDHFVTDNVVFAGGSVVDVAGSAVVARNVTFEAAEELQEQTCSLGIKLDGEATLDAEECAFGGRLGDTAVLYNANPAAGSLVLNSCDFSGSSAVTAVVSPHSDAEIRNAVVSDLTLENVATVNDSLVLVDRALGCDDENACGPGECMDSALGVLCECLEDGVCLNDGGTVSIGVQTPPPDETYRPDWVKFYLFVSAAADGTTPAIWNLTFSSEDLSLDATPSSGVLPPGANATVYVTGRSSSFDVGGNLVSRFVVTSVGSGAPGSVAVDSIDVESVFYLCGPYEYAIPVTEEDARKVTSCPFCTTVEQGAEGLDCEKPGATVAFMPVRPGFWRSDTNSLVFHRCLHEGACVGATEVSNSDDYCAEGYEGPYCAVCSRGYGKGVGSTCHSCKDTKSTLLIAAGSCFFVATLLLLLAAAVFLVGGLDALARVKRRMPFPPLASGTTARPACALHHGPSSEGAASAGRGTTNREGEIDAPATDFNREEPAWGQGAEAGEEGVSGPWSEYGGCGRGSASPPGVVAGEEVHESAMAGPDGARLERASEGGRAHLLVAGTQASDARIGASTAGETGKPGCCGCGLGRRLRRLALRLPLDKLKILVVVWQILTVFPSVTGVDYPPVYSRFLSWIDVMNFDIGNIFSASCALPFVDFYQRLLLTTLGPIGLGGLLVVTYGMAKRRAGIGSAGIAARRAAWSRHAAAGLLLTFLVFTSSSTMVFKVFSCDDQAVQGERYLRDDYGISCNTDKHSYFSIYAGIMILVYPVGIPLLYAYILWKNRHSLNPRPRAATAPGGEIGPDEEAKGDDPPPTLEEKLQIRRENPDLVPSMFLWKDFGPDMYYYEVIECGRRILLTGCLIFVAPGTAAQAAVACIFAFASLLGFELLRPHLDPADSWLYRLGCVVIFLSNFLALLIKVNTAGEGSRDVLGGIMVALNCFLILAVLFSTWFATQQTVDDSRDDENPVALAKTMLTFEQRRADDARTRAREMAASVPTSSMPPSGGAAVGQQRGTATGDGPVLL